MNRVLVLITALVAVVALFLSVQAAVAQRSPSLAGASLQAPVGTAFTYQGRLTDAGAPANGSYDFQFSLHDVASGSDRVESVVSLEDVAVADGLFAVQLDFGNVFTGAARWLDVAVRPGNSTDRYTALPPRQPLTPAPYAIHALSSASVPWSGIQALPAGFSDGVDNDSGGTITGVTAGAGLSGGGSGGNVTMAVNFAGSGVANTAARSDHPHSSIASATEWIVPYWFDEGPTTYTFLAVRNSGIGVESVTVSFYTRSGVKIADVSYTLVPDAVWTVSTYTGGGLAATRGGAGSMQITTSSGDVSNLSPWGAIMMSASSGLPLSFYGR